MPRDNIIGIDLGTTNSVVAVWDGGEAKVIPNQEGMRVTPSVVVIAEKGTYLVGEVAKRQAVAGAKRTISSIKRFMGRRHGEVEDEERLSAYSLVGGPEELLKVRVDDIEHAPSEISAKILRKLKCAAEDFLGQPITKAVITVPAYFNDAQRQATLDAANIAGFDTDWVVEDPVSGKKRTQRMRIINEPTAAALAYGLDLSKVANLAVFDLGGGTFDVSMLDVCEGVVEVKATNGDTHLGGDDFDRALIDHVAEEFKKKHNIDLREDIIALQRIKEACEQAKKQLSQEMQTDVNLPNVTTDAAGPKHLQLTITRSTFERLVQPLLDRCRQPVLNALRDARFKPSDVDDVVLVGGMTRVPCVQRLVKEIFGKEGLIGINPDEVVALGAAIQGAQLLLGSKSELLLMDVIPLSLGIETSGGVMTNLVERNTTIPCDRREVFMTADDNQRRVTIRVYQGERKMATSNRLLGRFNLEGIDPAPRGEAKIEVAFNVDANGVLNVTARDRKTGKEKRITIENSSGLSRAELDRLRKDADADAQMEKEKKISNAKQTAIRIFISYRRGDSEAETARIDERLKAHYGASSVFLDVNSMIPGLDFREQLETAIARSNVVLVIIGKDWVDNRYTTGTKAEQRRLDDPSDYVRIEIESALQMAVPVIPVLVGRAEMPTVDALPASLQDLAYRHAVEVGPTLDFDSHATRLIEGIDKVTAAKALSDS